MKYIFIKSKTCTIFDLRRNYHSLYNNLCDTHYSDSVMYVVAVLSILSGLTLAIENSPCIKYELVPCGDSKAIYQWEFCTINVLNQRITEVHLDTRYDNRYCKKSNFGITTNHEKMWVHQWCFGTFFVCFVPEEGFTKNSKTVADFDNNSVDNKRRKQSEESHKQPSTTVTEGYQRLTINQPTQNTDNPWTINSTNGIDNLLKNQDTTGVTERRLNTTDVLTNTTAHLINATYSQLPSSKWIQRSDSQSLPRITARVWIVAAVCVAGGTILIITGVIAFIILNGYGGHTDGNDRRLSQENTSTAHLVANDSNTSPEKSVYDFIPIDPETGFPSISGNSISSCDGHSERDVQEIDEQTAKLNIYDRTSCVNEYDVLNRRPKPCRSVSETSNYSHLGELGSVVTSEADTKNGDVVNHEYAILMPCDTGHFQFVEEETSCEP